MAEVVNTFSIMNSIFPRQINFPIFVLLSELKRTCVVCLLRINTLKRTENQKIKQSIHCIHMCSYRREKFDRSGYYHPFVVRHKASNELFVYK